MGLQKVGGEPAVVCDRCGEVITWRVDHSLKHGFTCTKCIDKDRGVFQVVSLVPMDLDVTGFDTDKLSDDTLAELAEIIKHELYIGPFYDLLKKNANLLNIPHKTA